MTNLMTLADTGFTFWESGATTRAARAAGRMAALHLLGIARYSSSVRLALRRTGMCKCREAAWMRESGRPAARTARAVQLPFLG